VDEETALPGAELAPHNRERYHRWPRFEDSFPASLLQVSNGANSLRKPARTFKHALSSAGTTRARTRYNTQSLFATRQQATKLCMHGRFQRLSCNPSPMASRTTFLWMVTFLAFLAVPFSQASAESKNYLTVPKQVQRARIA
jgi:hypothetical protein